jgi:hypothetical protein
LLALSTRAAADPNAAPLASSGEKRFPLTKVADVTLPGAATRFDYQDVDVARGHLVVAHMR